MISQLKNNQINYYSNQKLNQKQESFKGVGTAAVGALRFLDNSPAIGACAVDLGSMVIPRTIIDTKDRGLNAGAETAFRESSSTINHAVVGLVGLGAATAVSGAINHKYGISAEKAFVNNEAIDVFSDYWKATKGDKKAFFEQTLSNLEGLNGSVWNRIADVKKEDGTVVKNASSIISEVADKLVNSSKLSDKEFKNVKREIANIIVPNTSASSRYKLASYAGTESKSVVKDSLDVILDNMRALGNTFSDATQKAVSNGVKDFNIDDFAKEFKSTKLKSSLLGLGITSLIGVSIQPINRYITKKRTGSDGFVGVEGREADKSTKFKMTKLLAAGAFALVTALSIDKNPAKILNKLQFKSKVPSIDQFKLIYGATIASRLLSARDKSELRESTIRDTLGFSNWLILGGIVSKLAARGMDKSLINYVDSGKKGFKKALDWIGNASVKSYDEVLLDKAKDVLTKDGKALKFNQLFEGVTDKVAKAKVGKLAVAQILGYAYSGLVLGVGIAKLNIFITKKLNKGKVESPAKPQQTATSANIKFFAQNAQQSKVFAQMQK